MKRILCLSHEATFTGAPILLYSLCELLKQHGYEIDIVVLRGGPYESFFRKIGRITVLKPEGYGSGPWYQRIRELFLHRIKMSSLFTEVRNYDLIFSNTMANGKVLSLLSIWRKPVLVYTHELNTVLDHLHKTGHLAGSLRPQYHYLYPSSLVKAALEAYPPITHSPKKWLPYFLTHSLNKNSLAPKNPFSGKLKIFGSGTVSNRKGTDLFLQIARAAAAANASMEFTWIGGFETPEQEKEYCRQLPAFCTFTGLLSPDEATQFYQQQDLLLLCSREDPYPLVVIEAAMAGIPAVIPASNVGSVDFVESDAGFILPDFDNADAVVRFLSRLSLAEIGRRGQTAVHKAASLHQNPDLVLRLFREAVSAYGGI